MLGKNSIKKALSLIVLAAVLLSVGCGKTVGPTTASINAVDLMSGIFSKNTASPTVPSSESTDKAADFAVRLFKAALEEGNTLVSPLSVLTALAMTANGAEGETLMQMETVLGMDVNELNEFYYNYAAQLTNSEKANLKLANSIWFTADERFTVREDFLQKNADIFGADIYKAPFDAGTIRDVNDWVKKHTDNMIPEILDKDFNLDDIVMILVNALAFDAEWLSIYRKDQVSRGDFTLEDGSRRDAEFMYSLEPGYLSSDNATGFIKYYNGQKYAFVALLPNKGVSVSELVASLDGGKLMSILGSADETGVMVSIPKFETEFSAELGEVLAKMGMSRAFDYDHAEFAGLGASSCDNIRINSVIHKTFISVDERGTRAGAATAVILTDGGAFTEHSVFLDRPFVYMLIDTETNLPFFIGTMMEP